MNTKANVGRAGGAEAQSLLRPDTVRPPALLAVAEEIAMPDQTNLEVALGCAKATHAALQLALHDAGKLETLVLLDICGDLAFIERRISELEEATRKEAGNV
jgi:hypothetical protein